MTMKFKAGKDTRDLEVGVRKTDDWQDIRILQEKENGLGHTLGV